MHKYILTSFLFILLLGVPLELRAEYVSKVNISGLTTISEDVVRDVIPIKPGDEFSFQELDDSLSYLRKWGVFDVMEASPSIVDSSVVIRFHLEEAIIVESVNITGNYPYIENRIRKYLSLHAGDVYVPDRVDEQVDRIKAFYKRQGYLNTEVLSEIIPVPEVNGVEIIYHIRRGEQLRYNRIVVEGPKVFPKGRIVSEINPLKPYSERRLRDAIRNTKEFYQRNGYPKIRIKVIEKLFDFEKRKVDLAIDIHEGPHVILKFVGSPHISRKQLKKSVTIIEEGVIDDFEIEMSCDEVRKLLRKKGYPDAEVSGDKQLLKNGQIQITFDIDAGTPKKIRFVNFKGTDDVSSKALQQKMHNKTMSFNRSGAFYPEYISDDDESIESQLKKHGYLNPSIGEWEVKPTAQGYALDVTIPIDAGKQIIVKRINFNGMISFVKKRLLKSIGARENKPFNEPGVDEDRKKLELFLSDNGYPYAKVEANWEIDQENSESVINFNVLEGPLVKIGRILIVGDVLTSQKAIKQAMSLREGDRFSYRKVIESQLNIRRLGPFTSVNVSTIGLEEGRKIIPLRVKVEEQRPFMVDLGFNYSTDDQFTGSLTFTNVNAFGWAKTNALDLTGGRDLTRAELIWHDPRFLGSSLEMTTNTWVQYKKKPSYSYIQMAGAIGWFRRYRRLGFLFRWEMDRNYFITGDSVAADADSLRNNTISKISLSSTFDSRDSFSDPTKGIFTLIGGDIFNEIAGDSADFFRLSWEGESDLSPFRRVTFSTGLRFSRILTIGKNVSVPTNELLFLGGDDTIRGYSEDSLGPVDANGKATGARLRWIFNEELRLRIFGKFVLAGFFDMGSLTNSYAAINWNTIRRSAGLGIRYLTPVGPIRLDYGFKLDRRAGESKGRLHLTFGYVF
ncbi:MAG: outer membrane protein assembly factor BamA [Deltaproteobacteria bacterium]|jgi:outer membrane protein insertion porin family|nr:outer membrane protein assembly factor BamA [Deltaproteobacteria bacterium]